ncbi:tetratricopeptide repeat protein [Caballeronia sp. LZ035]|uniref:tetratricopeptide repeat protein n=1 Tax=Caballeronia sp. LZ035 TaxID=3038568 RepID=UPI0028640CB4|nr:tetratricopeptide repeat protein [Caballeronia sp. LZ035]MDR5760488.1 tetratricopeptide repeat protein [Caballeronia sp. LZ035]
MDALQEVSGQGPATSAEVARLLQLARRSFERQRHADAEAHLTMALALDACHPLLLHYLGRLREMQGRHEDAVRHFQAALAVDPSLARTRQQLAVLLVQLGREEESLPLWRAEAHSKEGLASLAQRVKEALCSRDLTLAGRYAAIAAELRWGRSGTAMQDGVPVPTLPPIPLSIPKLRHDIEQFEYLRNQGWLKDDFIQTIDAYRRVVEGMATRGEDLRVPIDGEEHDALRDSYNRLVHLCPAGRVTRALSGSWDSRTAERQYLDQRPGMAVVDDFLSPEALDGLRRFCLESTIWFHNRYAHGRLGAFFQDGFNCPLLLQIAEELRDALPHVIGSRYPLRQIWGFKNTQPLPAGVTTHADFAAVNVNFWITPDESNLDPASGGLVVYDVDAPMHWDFDTYNGSDRITPFLRRQQSAAVTIPYRQNRAVIFNSDLFHATAQVNFRPGYEHHRINVTMLYGDREDDAHHRQLARPDAVEGGASSWRPASLAALRKTRSRRA